MTTTISTKKRTERESFLLYSQITANVYTHGKDDNNKLSGDWQPLKLYYDEKLHDEFFDYDKSQRFYEEKIGFDAAIYRNKDTGEIIVAFRGTEFTRLDNDVQESARILNQQTNLNQYGIIVCRLG